MARRILYNPDQLSLSDLARYIDIPIPTLKSWLKNGRIPEPAAKTDDTHRRWTATEARRIKRMIKR